MPGKDGTGPLGVGPMSGRAAGFCNKSFLFNSGSDISGLDNQIDRGCRGMQQRFHRNNGINTYFQDYRRNFQSSSDSELVYLEKEVKALESSLEKAKERLSQLQNSAK